MDTPFVVKSHQVGLVQVAGVFRRYVELQDFGRTEKCRGESAHFAEWVEILQPRMLGRLHRWAKRSNSECTQWYVDLAPPSLVALN